MHGFILVQNEATNTNTNTNTNPKCECTPEDDCECCIYYPIQQNDPSTRIREDWLSRREKKILEIVLKLERLTPDQAKILAEEFRTKNKLS